MPLQTQPALNIALYQPEIAGNVGSIMRSCACFGVGLTLIEPCGFPIGAKAMRRAAMDYAVPNGVKIAANWNQFIASDAAIKILGKSGLNPAEAPISSLSGESANRKNMAQHPTRPARHILFTTKGATPLPDFTFQTGDHLIFGAEGSGVPDFVHEAAHARIAIPMSANARSLNLANSVAIAIFEALRQIRHLP